MNAVRGKVLWNYFSAFCAPVRSAVRPFYFYIPGATVDSHYRCTIVGAFVVARNRWSDIAIYAMPIDADFCCSAIGMHTEAFGTVSKKVINCVVS